MFNSSDNLAYEQQNTRYLSDLLLKYQTALKAALAVLEKKYGFIPYVEKLTGDLNDDEDNLRWASLELNKGLD